MIMLDGCRIGGGWEGMYGKYVGSEGVVGCEKVILKEELDEMEG